MRIISYLRRTHTGVMNEDIAIPKKDESPAEYAERLGNEYAHSSDHIDKKTKGQFFTPLEIARFMGSLAVIPSDNKVTVLDPGCGTAVLTCALLENLITRYENLEYVTVHAWDTDYKLLPYARLSLDYLSWWSKGRGVNLEYVISEKDFIMTNAWCLGGSIFEKCEETSYDYIISNPPYFKLGNDDVRTKACASVVDGATNIYALFMAICAKKMKPDGQMIFITPRSFTSGRYFQRFREFLFDNAELDFIHLFKTRRDTFAKDNVLQELIITSLRPMFSSRKVIVSNSFGSEDLSASSQKEYEMSEIVDIRSAEKVIYLPAGETEDNVLRLFRKWDGSLGKYGVKISTGPVVAFRAYDSIVSEEEADTVPLYWMHNVAKMLADHPVAKKDKGQYIRVCEKTRSALLPNKNYVLLRRFSTKDDSSRLIAAPYFGNMSTYEFVGIENKLNYIYKPGGRLRRSEVVGLSALLNSKLFDTYFRTFNGNINVSATELRMMPMPPLDIIQEIGDRIMLMNNYSTEFINELITEYFKI